MRGDGGVLDGPTDDGDETDRPDRSKRGVRRWQGIDCHHLGDGDCDDGLCHCSGSKEERQAGQGGSHGVDPGV